MRACICKKGSGSGNINRVDRRKYKRIPVRKTVIIGSAIKTQSLDLSESGMYIHTDHPFPSGHQTTISFFLDDAKITVKAVVVHSYSGIGIGVRFMGLDRDQMISIKSYIENHSQQDKGKGINKGKVLLVEDNVLTRTMQKSRLVLDGFAVYEAGDGVEALKLLIKEKINLVILDLQLPRLDGYKVLAMAKDNPEWNNIPILVCSSRTLSAEVERARAAGAAEFLSKAVTTPAKLSERVKANLKPKPSGPDSAG